MWSVQDYDVKNGETKRVDCPICKGSKTFTITNNMGSLVWNCYKASCTTSGGKRVRLTSEDIKKSFGGFIQETKEIPFKMPDFIVSRSNNIQTYHHKWSIPKDVGLMYDVKEDRVVFKIQHNDIIVDAIGRATDKRLPKWKRYGNSDLPYVYGCGRVAVVVEDCVSAVVVGDIDVYVGVAVLGTSLSESHKKYLSQFSTAVVALDPDALPKTIQFAKELRQYVDVVKVLRLTDDLKYRNEDDIKNLTNIGV